MSQNFDATCPELKSGSHCDEMMKWKAISLTHVEYVKGIHFMCVFSSCPLLFPFPPVPQKGKEKQIVEIRFKIIKSNRVGGGRGRATLHFIE